MHEADAETRQEQVWEMQTEGGEDIDTPVSLSLTEVPETIPGTQVRCLGVVT